MGAQNENSDIVPKGYPGGAKPFCPEGTTLHAQVLADYEEYALTWVDRRRPNAGLGHDV